MFTLCDCSVQDSTCPLGVTDHIISWCDGTRRDMWCSFYTNPSLAFNSLVRPRQAPSLATPAPSCRTAVSRLEMLGHGPYPSSHSDRSTTRASAWDALSSGCTRRLWSRSLRDLRMREVRSLDWPRGRAVTGERLVQSMNTRLRPSTRPLRTLPVLRVRSPGRRTKAWGGQWDRRCPRGK